MFNKGFADILTLHERVEGSWGREVGGDCDVLFVGALGLHPDSTVWISAVTAHPARGVSHVCQPPIVVIPEEMERTECEKRWLNLSLMRPTVDFNQMQVWLFNKVLSKGAVQAREQPKKNVTVSQNKIFWNIMEKGWRSFHDFWNCLSLWQTSLLF